MGDAGADAMMEEIDRGLRTLQLANFMRGMGIFFLILLPYLVCCCCCICMLVCALMGMAGAMRK